MKSEAFDKLQRGEEKKEIDEGLEDWFAHGNQPEEMPRGLHYIAEVVRELAGAKLKPEDVYQWYSQAMVRRDREPLAEDSFISHFFGEYSTDTPVAFGDTERGYALGFVRSGVFVPSHFAPRSLRKGYQLFSDLGESKDVAAVLVITPDLVETLSKMPSWHELPTPMTGIFRGMLQEKRLMYNSHPDVQQRMRTIFEEMMAESKMHQGENIEL